MKRRKSKIMRKTFIIVVGILLLSLTLHSLPAYSQTVSASCTRQAIIVHEDGSTEVNATLELTASSFPANYTFHALGPVVFAQAIDTATGVLLPIVYNGSNITITLLNSTTVRLYYVTLALTSKEGQYWLLQYNSPCRSILLLPGDAVPVEIIPQNPQPVLYMGKPALAFPPGEVTVKYMVIPVLANNTSQSPSPGSPQAPGTSGGSSTGGSSTGGGQASTGSVNGRGWLPWLVLAIIAGFAGVFLWFFISRRRGLGSGAPSVSSGVSGAGVEMLRVELDDRDRAILEALRAGGKTASELMEETGIPKTPLYRRLRKLIDAGLVDYYEEGGARKYRLRGGA